MKDSVYHNIFALVKENNPRAQSIWRFLAATEQAACLRIFTEHLFTQVQPTGCTVDIQGIFVDYRSGYLHYNLKIHNSVYPSKITPIINIGFFEYIVPVLEAITRYFTVYFDRSASHIWVEKVVKNVLYGEKIY